MYNYHQVCQGLLGGLNEREKDVLQKRFGLEQRKKETLEAIGQTYGITRERVRQIQEASLAKLKRRVEPEPALFQPFSDHLQKRGNLRKEDVFLKRLGGKEFQNEVLLLLHLAEGFERFPEGEEFYSLWTIDKDSLDLAKQVLASFLKEFSGLGSPLFLEEAFELYQKSFQDSFSKTLSQNALFSYLEASKKIEQGPQGAWGLPEWSQINPQGIKDKAYLALSMAQNPLHFQEVTSLINKLEFKKFRQALPQTVHNELIKDPRFVLVGRGIYALREWGYEPGVVKDVIFRILEKQGPLAEEEIIKKVLAQRQVKKSTVQVNLKKYFKRTKSGKYKS